MDNKEYKGVKLTITEKSKKIKTQLSPEIQFDVVKKLDKLSDCLKGKYNLK